MTAVTPVGGDNPYLNHEIEFTASLESAEIQFAQTASGDNTLLIDDVRVIIGELPPPGVVLTVALGDDNTVSLSWPASAEGAVLQGASDLNTGDWSDVTLPATQEGDQMVVTSPIDSAAAFFRLRLPE